MTGPSEAMRIHPVGATHDALALAGAWHYAIEADWGVQTPPQEQMMPGSPNAPYTLFDSRLAPLLPYGIRGVIWYQGENNADEPQVYRRLLPQMIADWRRAFAQGDVPFIQVQLANFMRPAEQPRHSKWAELRDAQSATTRACPNVGMAVAIDVGDAADIHPTDKRSVGERLARWALARTYGRPGAAGGPVFAGMAIEAGGRLRCRFTDAAGLRTRDGGRPSHVAIAGVDKVFVWAEAAIEGETLVAWSPRIAKPYHVRYAWADNPEGCNLVNGDGLPAGPFCTTRDCP
jgi:sialate O-acetylesterase